ncbi:DUF4185 domain-containing protein [uncultured Corynebacterium sp.]|uniref:DUF4185 domain-containing protein n=1 Tax=uncultured Corynebacterium sp. TaxID=159447 RepID=UPI0025FFAF2F|nr:DUF4185 domain-containing protein [uncultured Corynebacterium sp.]
MTFHDVSSTRSHRRSPRRFRPAMAVLSVGATAASLLIGAVVTGGTASAGPCSKYSPSTSDSLAALSGPSALGSASTPSWLKGIPIGLPLLSGNTKAMHILTGPNGPDQLSKFGLASTDLGFMWDAGNGRTLAAFGDSFSCGANNNGWHSNAIYESDDQDPSNGIHLTRPVNADRSSEFLPRSLKVDGVEMTVIPTTGTEVNGTQYLDFMSVKKWTTPGQWITNYAATAKSTDGGKTWSVIEGSKRTNTNPSRDSRLPKLPAHIPGAENFQMTAFAKPPAGSSDSYVYVYGTPNGRSGQARLARFPKNSFALFPGASSHSDAEFYNGHGWTRSMADAAPVLDGSVSELSVIYHPKQKAWLATYEAPQGVVVRKAQSPEGPWSSPKTLISRAELGDLYGAFMFPHQVDNDLYWVATTWRDYNPVVYRTDLSKVF